VVFVGENVNMPAEKKPHFLKETWTKAVKAWRQTWTKTVKVWKAVRNPIAWTLAAGAMGTVFLFFYSVATSRKDAPIDANGVKFNRFQEYVMPGTVKIQLDAMRQDSIYEAKKDSTEKVQRARADSTDAANKAAAEAKKSGKKNRKTSQNLGKDTSDRTGFAINFMKQQAVLRARHFQNVQKQKLKC